MASIGLVGSRLCVDVDDSVFGHVDVVFEAEGVPPAVVFRTDGEEVAPIPERYGRFDIRVFVDGRKVGTLNDFKTNWWEPLDVHIRVWPDSANIQLR